MRFTIRLISTTACAALAAIVSPAVAQTVVGASTITSPSGSYGNGYGLENIINQSGLSSGYVSGVTDYATFVNTTTSTSGSSFNTGGFTGTGGLPQTFTFGFASPTTIDGLAFFAVANGGSLTQFGLYADDDSNFNNGTSSFLGTFSPLAEVYKAQSFSFGAVTTSFLQLRALNTAGGTGLVPGIGEVAFRSPAVTAAVPEPATWAMMLVGFGMVGGAVRYRRRSVKVSLA